MRFLYSLQGFSVKGNWSASSETLTKQNVVAFQQMLGIALGQLGQNISNVDGIIHFSPVQPWEWQSSVLNRLRSFPYSSQEWLEQTLETIDAGQLGISWQEDVSVDYLLFWYLPRGVLLKWMRIGGFLYLTLSILLAWLAGASNVLEYVMVGAFCLIFFVGSYFKQQYEIARFARKQFERWLGERLERFEALAKNGSLDWKLMMISTNPVETLENSYA